MTTAMFIITSNSKTLKLLNLRHLVFPCTGVDTMEDSSQLTQDGSKVRRPCQSTIVGVTCAELLTGISEQPDLRKGILNWVDFYHYRVDVYTHFQHTFMFKQHVKLFLHPMTPLNVCPWKHRVFFTEWESEHKNSFFHNTRRSLFSKAHWAENVNDNENLVQSTSWGKRQHNRQRRIPLRALENLEIPDKNWPNICCLAAVGNM